MPVSEIQQAQAQQVISCLETLFSLAVFCSKLQVLGVRSRMPNLGVSTIEEECARIL